jgi:hypothetical protein
MKDLEFKCVNSQEELMTVNKKEEFDSILFRNVEKYVSKEKHTSIRLSQKDSLKLATTIIDEFCRTKKFSKKSLKSKIAYQHSIIQNLRQEINELRK